jgi:hypothetical protein
MVPLILQWGKLEPQFQIAEVSHRLVGGGDAVNREDFFSEGMFPHHLGALPDTTLIAFLSINLPHPAGVPVTGCAHLDLGMEVAEVEFLNVFHGAMGHDPSLNQKGMACTSDNQTISITSVGPMITA